MTFCVPKYILLDFVVNMSVTNDPNSDVAVTDDSYHTPRKESPSLEALVSAVDDLGSDADSERESNFPVEISASNSVSHKQNKNSAISLLSPSSSTRSKATRKRSTPEKYEPSMRATVKRKTSPVKSRPKATTATKATKSPSQSQIVEVIDVENELPKEVPIPDNETVLKLERDAHEKLNKANMHPDDKAIIDAAEESERKFLKSLFKITWRNFSNITWPGWLFGYCREIRLTDFARDRYLPLSEYNSYSCLLCFVLSYH